MSLYDFNTQRLFVDCPIRLNTELELNAGQSNYLVNVLRLKDKDKILIFNGSDGEWLAQLVSISRKKYYLSPFEQTRFQPVQPELCYAFAPLKSARLDYMVQKAVEMGVSHLLPIITRRTQVTRLNLERMKANVIEAAEQCGILDLAKIEPPIKFEEFISSQSLKNKTLIFCDEDAPLMNPVSILKQIAERQAVCVLVGPEGGFDNHERQMLLNMPNCVSVSLGPRILRADTAAVAILSVVQSTIGDWQ